MHEGRLRQGEVLLYERRDVSKHGDVTPRRDFRSFASVLLSVVFIVFRSYRRTVLRTTESQTSLFWDKQIFKEELDT